MAAYDLSSCNLLREMKMLEICWSLTEEFDICLIQQSYYIFLKKYFYVLLCRQKQQKS